MGDESLLSTEEVTKTFPGVRALDHVSFELRRGEVHAILGENGAGKSTLIKILGGVYSCEQGHILLEGEEIRLRGPRDAQLKGIRVIHQELNLLPLLSVAENIFLGNLPPGALPGTVSWREMQARAREVLGRMGITLDVTTLVRNLTTAELQLVEIAQALTTESRIIIMDEPTAALNQTEVKNLFSLLRRMTASGIGVIYITHRIAEVFEIADRVTVLRDGMHVATLNVKETTTDQLVQLMVGRTLTEMYPRNWGQPGEVVLEARGLSSRDGLLKTISLNLRQGEILGMYGLLGSGCSQLAQILFGASPLSSGQILVRGKVVNLSSPNVARRLGFGYVPVERRVEGLFIALPVRKNLTIASLDRYVRGPFVDERKEAASANHWTNLLHIRTPSVENLISSLSGGNQQKIVVGRWLDAQSRILIMNEPTHGVDVGAKVEIYSLMDDLCRQGVAVLMVSTEMPELLAMADRILVMSAGRITGEFAHGQVDQETLMKYAVT